MPAMCPPHTAWPASLPASRMPVMSFLVFLSSFSYCAEGEGGDGEVASEGEGQPVQPVQRFSGSAVRRGVGV